MEFAYQIICGLKDTYEHPFLYPCMVAISFIFWAVLRYLIEAEYVKEATIILIFRIISFSIIAIVFVGFILIYLLT